MTRLLIHVEGETEEAFVNELLAPHLYEHGFTRVGARLVGNARMRERRGGIRAWQAVKKDIARHLQEDVSAASATFVDFYALPESGQGAWPGRSAASAAPTRLLSTGYIEFTPSLTPSKGSVMRSVSARPSVIRLGANSGRDVSRCLLIA